MDKFLATKLGYLETWVEILLDIGNDERKAHVSVFLRITAILTSNYHINHINFIYFIQIHHKVIGRVGWRGNLGEKEP